MIGNGTKTVLFVGGCPRSGTTPMMNILNAHEAILIGEERYQLRCIDDERLREQLTRAQGPLRTALEQVASTGAGIPPDGFSVDRFLDIRLGDTFYSSFEEIGLTTDTVRAKLLHATVVGDKIPKIYEHLRRTSEIFPTARFILMLRNLYDVACSYQSRAMDPSDNLWSEDTGWQVGVREWNDCLYAIKKYPEQNRLLVIPFEDFFLRSESLGRVWEFLNVSPSEAAAAELEKVRIECVKFDGRKSHLIGAREKQFLLSHGETGTYREVLKQPNCVRASY